MISAGGALGGLSVSLIAPLVFKTYAEWKISLCVGFVLAAVVAFALAGPKGWRLPRWGLPNVLRAAGILVSLVALAEIVHLLENDSLSSFPVLERSRDFYGVLTVIEEIPGEPYIPRALAVSWRHPAWNAIHRSDRASAGHNLLLRGKRVGPDTQLLSRKSSVHTREQLRIGVVGLGVGTVATYVDLPWHSVRFYEINPEVSRLAEKYFTFLADARAQGATVEIVLGDARLSLERERDDPQAFDVLVLDAFSSDSIPIHLLTKEAFEIYLEHLAPGGAIAVHISNRDLDLSPVVFGLAEHFGLKARRIFSVDAKHGGWGADWVIVSRNAELLAELHLVEGTIPRDPPEPPFPLWTDQRHNLLEVVK